MLIFFSSLFIKSDGIKNNMKYANNIEYWNKKILKHEKNFLNTYFTVLDFFIFIFFIYKII